MSGPSNFLWDKKGLHTFSCSIHSPHLGIHSDIPATVSVHISFWHKHIQMIRTIQTNIRIYLYQKNNTNMKRTNICSRKCSNILEYPNISHTMFQRAFSMLWVKCQGSNFTKLYYYILYIIYYIYPGMRSQQRFRWAKPGAEYVETPLPRLL